MKKKVLALALALAVIAGLLPAAALAAEGGTAYAVTQEVEIDGQRVAFQMYALKDESGGMTNYVKLRDVAYVFKDTMVRFSVDWNGKTISVTSGAAYTETGTEMTTPYSGDRSYRVGPGVLEVDGAPVKVDTIVLTDDQGGDYTYFKLRDLGGALDFTVDWTAERGVFIETKADLRQDQAELLMYLLLYGKYQDALGQAKRTPLQQIQGIWYGKDDGRGTVEEIQIKDDKFLSTTYIGGVYRHMSATISEVTGSSGNFRIVLRNGTTVTVGGSSGGASTSSWAGDLYWFYYNIMSQSARGSTVSRLSRASSLELYPKFAAALANSYQ